MLCQRFNTIRVVCLSPQYTYSDSTLRVIRKNISSIEYRSDRFTIYGRRRQAHYILPLSSIFSFFYFVSINERPAMRSQPNLASRSEVVSIYKYLKILGRPFPKFWAQKHHTLDHFFLDFRTPHYISGKTSHRQTKMLLSIYNVSPKSLITFRDL